MLYGMIIHQIWIQGEDKIPQKYRITSRKLRRMNPEFEYKVWSGRELEQVCRSLGPPYHHAWKQAKHLHQHVDFGRYCVIYAYGGISIDMDVEPLRPIREVVDIVPKHTLGVTKLPVNATESSIVMMAPRPWFLNNATLIAHRPRLPAAKILIDRMADRLSNQGWRAKAPKSMAIWTTTGPRFFNETFAYHIDPSLYTAIPAEYFEPCSGFDKACRPTPKTVVSHMHAASWHSYGHVAQMYYTIRRDPMARILCVLIISILLVLCVNCIRRRR